MNQEYLRKNVKLSCSDESQLLEFYRKLRLCIQKGGIYLAPLESLTPEEPIYNTDMGLTTNDITTQSNALYTLLTNEDIISNDYTQAQNCLSTKSDTMDGFGALKNLLNTIHPNFTN